MLKIFKVWLYPYLADAKFVLESSKANDRGSSPNIIIRVHLKIVSSLYFASGINFSKERKEQFYVSGAVHLLCQIKVSSKYYVNG